jgi:hypothetical protein
MTQPDTQGDVYGDARNFNNNGETLEGGISVMTSPVQDTANGETVDPSALLNYHNVGHTDDYLNQNAGLTRTNKPSRAYQVAVARPVAGVSGIVVTSAGLVSGWSFAETAGATAKIRIRSGIDVNQAVLMVLTLSANESTRDFLTLPVEFKAGLYLELVSGAVEGVIYTVESRRV